MATLKTTNTTPAQRWTFLAVISLGLLMLAADNSILYAALPTLRLELGTSELEGLWILNAYPLVMASLLLGTGTLGDKIGHRRMFEIGLGIFGLASLIAAFAPNPEILIGARALLGVGAATMMPATLALIRVTFTDVQERNTAIGIWGSVATIGAALGPILGGILLSHYWWGSIFLINVPLVIIAMVATYFLAPANMPMPEKHWDFLSSFLAMLTMLGLVFAIKTLAHSPIDWTVLGIALVVMVVAGYLFGRRQRILPEPVLTWDVFSNKLFSAGVFAAAMSMFVLTGTELLTTQRFQLAEGFTPLQVGLITGVVALAAFPTSIWGGVNLARVGFRPIIGGGFAMLTVALVLAIISLSYNHFGGFIVAMILGGLGVGLIMSVASTAIIGSAPARRAGIASAVEEVSYEFGSLLSVAVLGSLMPAFYAAFAPPQIAHEMDAAAHSPEYAPIAAQAIDHAYILTMSIAAVASAIATVISFYLLRDNPKETEYAHE